LATNIEYRILDRTEPADVRFARGKGLHAHNQARAPNNVLETLGQDCPTFCLITYTPRLGYQPPHLISHQYGANWLIDAEHTHFGEGAGGN